MIPVWKIISGGQTGVDRAALDAALESGFPVGGWCPSGRRAEDGRIDARYPLRETPSAEYAQRTAWNVRDSDGTLVLHRGMPVGGTALTIVEAERLGRPLLSTVLSEEDAAEKIRTWLIRHAVETLNVAGPRESEARGIYAEALVVLRTLLQAMKT